LKNRPCYLFIQGSVKERHILSRVFGRDASLMCITYEI
jgi:hypothetical protein